MRRPPRRYHPTPETLRNWNGATLAVTRRFGRRWVVKPSDEESVRRERLASALGRGRVNVCPVRPHLGRPSILVRLAQDLRVRSLPQSTLDRATAGELVFSLWIRRRDAHVWNREYLDDLPVFFDLAAAFEPSLLAADRDAFFSTNRYGYAGSWRVKERAQSRRLDTLRLRLDDDHTFYVDDLSDFAREIVSQADDFARLSRRTGWLRRRARAAGYPAADARRIAKALARTGSSLPRDARRLLAVVSSDDPTSPALALPMSLIRHLRRALAGR